MMIRGKAPTAVAAMKNPQMSMPQACLEQGEQAEAILMSIPCSLGLFQSTACHRWVVAMSMPAIMLNLPGHAMLASILTPSRGT